jgi:hypothetical protein
MALKEKGRPAGGDPIPNAVCQDEPESISQPDQLQAPPDDTGESDLAFFTKRPGVNTRTRLPFAGEFPPGVLEPGRGAFVHVFLASRDPKTNAPGTRARAIFYADDGGRA